MTEASTEPARRTVVNDDATMPAGDPEPTAEVHMPRWQGALIALGSLVLVYGLGLGFMAAGGAVLHAIKPTKTVDAFAALHNHWVVWVLGGIGVLWLLPPYPWTRHAVEAPMATPSRAADTDASGGEPMSAALGEHHQPPGDAPDPRPKGGALTPRT